MIMNYSARGDVIHRLLCYHHTFQTEGSFVDIPFVDGDVQFDSDKGYCCTFTE